MLVGLLLLVVALVLAALAISGERAVNAASTAALEGEGSSSRSVPVVEQQVPQSTSTPSHKETSMRVSLETFRNVLAFAKADLSKLSDDKLVEKRYRAQVLRSEEHKVTCFERIRAAKQKGAAHLYRKALSEIIERCNAELARRNAVDPSALPADGVFVTYDDLTARDAAAAELVA